ncbi:MAG: hypothetical protein SFU56_07400 [Capsulimonadales bacterium]|nr:hypothetical protein [Capsulimonadales bacterium]
MSQVLLWVSLVLGVVAVLLRFLPLPPVPGRPEGESVVRSTEEGEAHPVVRRIGFAAPFLGFALTLPVGGVFSSGQQFGIGFLAGGVSALLADFLVRTSKSPREPEAIPRTAANGLAIAVVAAVLLFLPASRLDALLGVAIGWLCPAFAFLLALPATRRAAAPGRGTVAAVGMAVTLCAGAALCLYRDPITSQFPKLSWTALLLAFAALGTLVNAGTARFEPFLRTGIRRLLPIAVLAAGAGIALFQADLKLVDDPRTAWIGVGGLLLLPVVLAALREAARRAPTEDPGTIRMFLPAVLLTTGFLAAVQTLQGTGAAVFTVALWLALPPLLPFAREESGEGEPVENDLSLSLLNLLLFGTTLLLWRLFVTRWSGELHGVSLTDQYALFGLILGAAIPDLLSSVPSGWSGGKTGGTVRGIAALTVTALLALAVPALPLVLFGPKSVVAVLIGLGLGVGLRTARHPSLFPALIALAVTLVLTQWTGTVLPEQAWSRVDKVRVLIGLMAVLVPLTVFSDRFMVLLGRRETR